MGLPQLSYVPANIKITRAEIRHYLGLNRPHWITLPTSDDPSLLAIHTRPPVRCMHRAYTKKRAVVLYFLVKVVRTNLPPSIAYYIIAYFTSRDAPASHVRLHAFNIELHPWPCSFFFLSASTKIVSRQDLLFVNKIAERLEDCQLFLICISSNFSMYFQC